MPAATSMITNTGRILMNLIVTPSRISSTNTDFRRSGSYHRLLPQVAPV
jgi:hypothetical protein